MSPMTMLFYQLLKMLPIIIVKKLKFYSIQLDWNKWLRFLS